MSEFKEMKVADLRRVCEEEGLPSDGKKAELVERLEALYADDKAEYVDAVPVETGIVPVKMVPGILEFDLSPVREKVAATLAAYDGWEPNPEDPAEVDMVAKHCAGLNSMKKELEDRRKAVERRWKSPLDAFSAEIRALAAEIDETVSRLRVVQREAEDAARDAKLDGLREYYEGLAGTFAELVPWERIEDRRWGNKTAKESKSMAEIDAALERLTSEWKTLHALEFRDVKRAEAVWVETLDLGETLRRVGEEEREAERIEAAKSEVEQAAAERDESLGKVMHGPADVRPAPQVAEEKRPCVMIIDAAGKTQLGMLGKYASGIGIHGRFVWGTLREAAETEAWNV